MFYMSFSFHLHMKFLADTSFCVYFSKIPTANSNKYQHIMQLNSAVKLRVRQTHKTRKVI